jgi:hypothetical protein
MTRRAGQWVVLLLNRASRASEETCTMGEKSKGKDANNVKKPKAAKVGNRPHEQRERQAGLVSTAPESVKGKATARA